jgi:CHAD domain-containing protein
MARSDTTGGDQVAPAPLTGQVEPDMTCETALAVLLDQCAADLTRHLAEVMQSPAPEGPHKARVALRRLTTALDAFAGLLRGAERRAWRRRAKAIFHRLGRLRDADVYLATARSAHKSKRQIAALKAEGEALRRATRDRLTRDAAEDFAPALRAALASGVLFRQGPTGLALRQQSLAPFAAATLRQAGARAARHGPRIAPMTAEARHAFRKDLKSLRYLTEFFAPLSADAPTAHHVALAALQDDLGLLNDLATARRRDGKALGRSKPEKAALARAEAHWARVRAAITPGPGA